MNMDLQERKKKTVEMLNEMEKNEIKQMDDNKTTCKRGQKRSLDHILATGKKFGETKYGGNRFFHGFFDLFTMLFTSRYFDRPLHFFGSIGLLFIFISFA